MRILVSLIVLFFVVSGTAMADEVSCFKAGSGCSDIDIDSPKAEAAFKLGCDKNDFYSCARLGQFYEVKNKDLVKAALAYDKSCAGKDSYGCTGSYDVYMELCFLQQKKELCGKREPKGDFRVIAYLTNFDPKYSDAFATHSFESRWTLKPAAELFEKRVKEKNKKLLRALEREMKSKRHDGADAEGLRHFIKCVKMGGCPKPNLNEGFGGPDDYDSMEK